jgi:mono/diheme cytochrome c family protein
MKTVWLAAILIIGIAFAFVVVARESAPVRNSLPESGPGAAALFGQYCAKCHGRDGRAKGIKAKVTGTRNLTDAQWQDRVSDERIFNAINNGKGKMPGFGKKLSEAQVDSLVQYVRGLKK